MTGIRLKAELAFNKLKAGDNPHGVKLSDSDGLYMLAKGNGKYWRLNYTMNGKRKVLAIGVYPAVTLAQARIRGAEAREQIANGTDPNVEKRNLKDVALSALSNTFEVIARQWLTKTEAKRATNTQRKVTAMLDKDIFPFIGKLPISSISTRDVLTKVIARLEKKGVIETSHRVKQLIGQVFRYAVVQGLAERDVTAELQGALTTKTVTHNAAITDPVQFGALLRSLHGYEGHPVVCAALKLTPLVFCRPGEVRSAAWSEIDFAKSLWLIPAAKTKMRKDFYVPLSRQAVEILQALKPFTGHGTYVFPSIRGDGRPMSDGTVNSALRALGYDKETHNAHGFRASARTIMAEVMNENPELLERQLSHAIKGDLGATYDRTKFLPARTALMQRWSDFCDELRQGAKVIPLHGTA